MSDNMFSGINFDTNLNSCIECKEQIPTELLDSKVAIDWRCKCGMCNLKLEVPVRENYEIGLEHMKNLSK
jgi:hypothetical protein